MGLINEPEFSRYYIGKATKSLSGGPERIVTNEPDPNFVRRPVGFTANLDELVTEPMLWEGDGA